MIEIFRPPEVDRARSAGAVVANALQELRERAAVGVNLLDIDEWARQLIVKAGAQSCYVDYSPSFGNGPFRHYICTAVNDAVLHGMPNDYALQDGDLLTLDLAVLKDGMAADAAVSFIVGPTEPASSVRLIKATENALAAAIDVARPGNRIGDISHAIGSVLEQAGYSINTEFGGHGLAPSCMATRTYPTPDALPVGTSFDPVSS